MTVVSIKQRVAAPVEVAWAAIIDIDGYPKHVGSYVRVEFMTSNRTGVGARWRQWRTVFGREHDQTIEITTWEPPRRLVTTAQESGATYETTYLLEAEGSETLVTMAFEVRPLNPVASLFQRLLGRRLLASTREAMERDLSDLAAAAVAEDRD
jgi:uncharacterized protein YndB with AHSA1/START domain